MSIPVLAELYDDNQHQFPDNCRYMAKVTGSQPIKIVAIPGTRNS
jgi:hypothetical protein